MYYFMTSFFINNTQKPELRFDFLAYHTYSKRLFSRGSLSIGVIGIKLGICDFDQFIWGKISIPNSNYALSHVDFYFQTCKSTKVALFILWKWWEANSYWRHSFWPFDSRTMYLNRINGDFVGLYFLMRESLSFRILKNQKIYSEIEFKLK